MFEAILVYKVGSRTARAVIQRNLVSKNKQTKSLFMGFVSDPKDEANLSLGILIT